MTFLIIRHGESEADLLDVHEGRADFELTARGYLQAEAMAEYVVGQYAVTRIYASTLRRASQTAAKLARRTGLTVIPEPDLMEFDNGLLAGMSRREAAEKYPEVKGLLPDQSVYGQESKVQFRARACRVFDRILKEAGEDDVIAIVTHGGMINQLYRVWLEIPIGSESFFATGDTGIHVWKIRDGKRYVIKANDTMHTNGI